MRTFHIPRLIPSLTVLENLLVFYDYSRCASIGYALRRKWLECVEKAVSKAMGILRDLGPLEISRKKLSKLWASKAG